MKIATVATILSASLVTLLAVSATALLSDLGEPTADLRYEDIQSGWLLTMFCGPTLWSSLPTFPQDFASVLDSSAFAYICVCLVGLAGTAWRRPVMSRTAAAMLTLGLGFIPSVVGAAGLHDGSASPADAGAWASFMIMALLYAAVASLALATTDLPRPSWCPALRFSRTSALAA